jgi:hypothetical protein
MWMKATPPNSASLKPFVIFTSIYVQDFQFVFSIRVSSMHFTYPHSCYIHHPSHFTCLNHANDV